MFTLSRSAYVLVEVLGGRYTVELRSQSGRSPCTTMPTRNYGRTVLANYLVSIALEVHVEHRTKNSEASLVPPNEAWLTRRSTRASRTCGGCQPADPGPWPGQRSWLTHALVDRLSAQHAVDVRVGKGWDAQRQRDGYRDRG